MRLWHQFLIPYLDIKHLLELHRECCTLRGKGWHKKHHGLDYISKYDLAHLYQYHVIVIHYMTDKSDHDSKINPSWYSCLYRGHHMPDSCLSVIGSYVYTGRLESMTFKEYMALANSQNLTIYKEHDVAYLKECLLELKAKNAKLDKCRISIEEMLVNLDLELNS